MSDNSRVRVSIVGVVIVALFSTLLVRLWFLQSGPENSLKVQAVVDSTRVLQSQTPRGEILDRNGVVLVKDKASWAVTIDRNLSKPDLSKVVGQLAELLHAKVGDLLAQYNSQQQSPLEPAVVFLDVSQPDRLEILQDPQDYPGVHVVELTVREYPQGELAAQVLGYVGEIPSDELKKMEKLGYQPGDEMGLAGAEAAFEPELRGKPRRETVEVDPSGQQVGGPVKVDPGSVGDDVYLTIDARVQKAAETSLIQGMKAARTLDNPDIKTAEVKFKAPAGAVVVLDANDGSVVALASNPTYDPNVWTGGISQTNYDLLTNPLSDYPLLNRATQGLYAPGSTFKLVTALAMAKNNIQSINYYYPDTGSVSVGGQTFYNANKEQFGPVDLQQAITVSSDAYFYNVGNQFWKVWKAGDKTHGLGMQSEALELGFGAATGLELDEEAGRVPSPSWKSAFAHANYKSKTLQDENAAWYPGDDMNLAVGQGDLVVTPLQLANAYAAFANDGTLWQPHIEDKVVDAQGKTVSTAQPKAIRHLAFDPSVRAAMLAGFQGVVAEPPNAEGTQGGTAYTAFQGFPLAQYSVAGKTGTAQVNGKGDTSLFSAMFNDNGTEYVVVAVVEQAGFGAQTAAPIVRRIMETMTGQHPTDVQVSAQGHD